LQSSAAQPTALSEAQTLLRQALAQVAMLQDELEALRGPNGEAAQLRSELETVRSDLEALASPRREIARLRGEVNDSEGALHKCEDALAAALRTAEASASDHAAARVTIAELRAEISEMGEYNLGAHCLQLS
jgi:chromosome segregation ATPase